MTALKLEPYQAEAAAFLLMQPYRGLLLDPGLGKTVSTLTAIRAVKFEDPGLRVLVVAPKRVCYSVWPNEVRKFDEFKDMRVSVLLGTPAARRKAFAEDADVYVINREGLPWLAEQDFEGRFDWVIVDESTKFKSPKLKTKSGKPSFLRYLLEISKGVPRRSILTGTPAPNSYVDLFAQIFFLDRGKALGKSFTAFKREFCNEIAIPGQKWKRLELKEGAEERIENAISGLVLRMTADGRIKLPEERSNVIRVALPPDARRTYTTMQRKLFVALEEGDIAAASKVAAYGVCKQIANGHTYEAQDKLGKPLPTAQRKAITVHTAKVDALADLHEELYHRPLLVAYSNYCDLWALQKRFPGAPAINGGTTPEECAKIEREWNAGKLPILFAQPAAMSHGLNMQGTNGAICWFGLTDSLEAYLQFNARLIRRGGPHSVVVHHIVAEGTVDDMMLERIGEKDDRQTALSDALLRYREAVLGGKNAA